MAPEGAHADGEPFVRLDDSTGARSYLASLQSAAGVELTRLVVKVPRLSAAGVGSPSPPLTQVDTEWAQRQEDLRALSEVEQRAFPRLLLPAAGDGESCLLPPMVYCHVRQRLFRIPHPQSLRPLVTCRDDQLLSRAGLPPYASSSPPLLYEPGTEAEAEGTSFFIASEEAPAELVEKGVRGLAELRRALGTTLDGGGADPADFPAATEAQDGAAPWSVFTERDTPFIVTPYGSCTFDRFADYLGGRFASDDGSETWPGGYLFSAEGSGLDAVEVLTLKLTLFSQITAAVAAYYRALGPHLDLHPGHLVVASPDPLHSELPGRTPPHPELPHRWSFQVRLLGLSTSRRVRLAQDVETVLPPPRPRRPFSSRAVREASLIEPQDGELTIVRLFEESDGRWVVEGRLRDPNGILPPPRDGDLLVLLWPHQLLGAAEFATTARPDLAAAGDAAELSFVTEPLTIAPAAAERLEKARGTALHGGRYRLYPRLHVIDDLYSLGVLLLRLLLVNDRQDLGLIEKVLQSIPDQIHPERRGGTGSFNFEQALEASMATALEEQAEILSQVNVFYHENDRLASRANSIPLEPWYDTLRLAWRLIARGPGFGLGAGGGFDELHPASHLDLLNEEVSALLRRLRLVLFRRQAVHVEVHSVIVEMLTELG